MAENLDAGGYWLPPEILADDELITGYNTEITKPRRGEEFSYAAGNWVGLNSNQSSPVESVMGSTETESDEDDCISFLAGKIARSTLHDSKISCDCLSKGWQLSRSPQSILYGCRPGSSRRSPNCISGFPSPHDVNDTTELDLCYEVKEGVLRNKIRVKEETTANCSTKILSPSSKPCPVTLTPTHPNPATGYYPDQKPQTQPSYQQLLASKFQGMNREIWGAGKRTGNQFQIRENERTHACPTWLQSQRQTKQMPGSGMTTFFLPENGWKKERIGTGVFLPRTYGINSPETRKKSVCSSVLLPDRVVQVLNLNLDTSIDIPVHSQSRDSHLTLDYEAALKQRTNVRMGQKMRNLRPQPQAVWLPPEWTY